AKQVKAYEVAAQEDEDQLNKDADTEEKKQAAREAYRPTKYWLEDQRSSLNLDLEKKKVAIDEQADAFKKELLDTASDAREKIRDSAAKKLGYQRGWWQRLMDLISDWGKKAKLESAAWAQVQSEENAQSVAKDSEFLDTELAKLSKMTEKEVDKELAG